MNAIILHDFSEEIIGTVLIKEDGTFDNITNAWDDYLKNLTDDDPDIYEFAEQHTDKCEVLSVDFYQPSNE